MCPINDPCRIPRYNYLHSDPRIKTNTLTLLCEMRSKPTCYNTKLVVILYYTDMHVTDVSTCFQRIDYKQ